MKKTIRKNIHNMSQGLPNPLFMQEKVQKGNFLKKTLVEIDFFCFLGSYESLGRRKSKLVVFLPPKSIDRQCEYSAV